MTKYGKVETLDQRYIDAIRAGFSQRDATEISEEADEEAAWEAYNDMLTDGY